MAVTNWNTTVIDGKNYLVIDLAKLRIPLDWDPSSNVFLAVAAPDGVDGDALASYPALVQGDPGDAAALDPTVNVTVLDYDDATPDSASWALISPGVYQYTTTQRRGPTGASAANNILDALDLVGTQIHGKILQLVSNVVGGVPTTQVALQTPKVGDWYTPATIVGAPSGNPGYTLSTIPIPSQDFDCRVEVQGQTIVTGTGTNVVTDLVARLGGATTGDPEIGRCFGMTSTERLILSPGVPPGSTDSYDIIAAGSGTVNVYLRTERQAGTDTYTTQAATTRFRARVCPIP